MEQVSQSLALNCWHATTKLQLVQFLMYTLCGNNNYLLRNNTFSQEV